MFYVYCIKIEGSDDPVYIGKTNRPGKRLTEHKSQSMTEETTRDVFLKPYFESNSVSLSVLYCFDSEDDAFNKEQELILKYGRLDIGSGILLNETDGGRGAINVLLDDDMRKKMSDSKLGNKINIGVNRDDMREIFNKEISMYDSDGYFVSSFRSAREADRSLGISYKKISAVLVGDRFFVIHKGRKFTFRYGRNENKIDPMEKSSKLERKQKYKIIQKDENGVLVASFNSALEAKRKTGITGISDCIRGKAKTAKGFIWDKVPV